ncbi:MAG: hypothetical protein IKZ79_06710 [Spirochaetia bacterium]|nr:hypothetical protein [Spirochaetales bacterium]MBR5928119.1 hypothetical protein [Spirochaetia bacterium]
MKKILRFCKNRVLDLIYQVNYRIITRRSDKPLSELSVGKLFRLDIPTYDGSGQAVHPSLLVQDDKTAGGNPVADGPQFVLAFTPYTDTDDRVENPSVVISDDGLNFREEKPGLNPLVPAPEKDHNDDPDLFYSNGKYGLLYLETKRPEKQSLILLESADRIHWEKHIIHEERFDQGSGCFMLSPKYIEKDGLSYLFYVNRDATGGYQIEYVTGKDVYSLDFADRKAVTVSGLKELPWHLDIIRHQQSTGGQCHHDAGDGWYMLLTTARDAEKDSRYTLRIAHSRDLVHWQMEEGFAVPDCYRSSGFIKDGVMYLYISKIFLPSLRRKRWKILLLKLMKK